MPTIRDKSADGASDVVSIKVAGDAFSFWSEMELTRAIDTHPTFGLIAPFEESRNDFRATFRPFSFRPVQIEVGGDLLFTGTLMGVEPSIEASSRSVSVSGYSRAAVLQDSDIPVQALPFQTLGMTLRAAAEKICAPFGLDVIMTKPDNVKFRKIRPEIEGRAQDFLMRLAQQRGYVLSSDERGDLLIQKSVSSGKPVARLRQGFPPVTSVTVDFNPQDYCTEITGFVSAKGGRIGARHTVKNTRAPSGVLRTKICRLEDLERGDAPAAVEAKMGRMFANMVSYVVTVPTWRDASGKLWKPNTTVTLLYPDAMVYSETELLVREVKLRKAGNDQTATLTLVLPGAFSGETPERFPWDE